MYVVPVQAGQNTMDLLNKTGNVSGAGARCGNPNGTTYNCPNLWLARTAGVTGDSAKTLTSNQSGLVSAQPADGVGIQHAQPCGPHCAVWLQDVRQQYQDGRLPLQLTICSQRSAASTDLWLLVVEG